MNVVVWQRKRCRKPAAKLPAIPIHLFGYLFRGALRVIALIIKLKFASIIGNLLQTICNAYTNTYTYTHTHTYTNIVHLRIHLIMCSFVCIRLLIHSFCWCVCLCMILMNKDRVAKCYRVPSISFYNCHNISCI